MKKMTPREALYYVCLELGPQTTSEREDNITQPEARLRDAVKTLKNFITYHNDADKYIPESANEYAHHDDYIARPLREPLIEPYRREEVLVRPSVRAENRGDGEQRIENWKKEVRAKLYPHRT